MAAAWAESTTTASFMPKATARSAPLPWIPSKKKPLRRFYPGSTILSVGSYGCNLACEFCQNWQISQRHAATTYYAPEELVGIACAERINGNIGIAFTYNEPLITFEYVLDTSRLAHAADLKTVLVTNGLVNPDPLRELLPHIDAMNIDLKAFHESFYTRYCHGPLEPVKRTIEIAAPVCHVELTTLLIPGLNDDEDEIDELACFVASVDHLIPLHLTRHHPAYKMPSPARFRSNGCTCWLVSPDAISPTSSSQHLIKR
jgi:pyruvate formate lyase activating enzyme